VKTSNLTHAVFLVIYNTERWTKSIKPVLLSVVHHRQNPSDSTDTAVRLSCSAFRRVYCSGPHDWQRHQNEVFTAGT
jgi:hypothetical protein